MESLGEQPWDAVIDGTGLQQALLALALSRSDKRILHIDPNDYYGQHEAAFSLQEAETWAAEHESVTLNGEGRIFRNASVWKHAEAQENGLSFPRAYSLALAPQIIHTRSKLLAQLVSSRAYRQVDFLAVGSFFVYEAAENGSDAKLTRIPSSREDIFSTQAIPARSKRTLMKFLKFVLDFDSEEQTAVWEPESSIPLSEFLVKQFKLDESLQRYILALTLTLDGNITVKDGLTTINRHLTSTGLFGPGFCAVYPKWGGTSEIAQVGCRAGAVGGGIYMLATSIESQQLSDDGRLSLALSNGVAVQTGVVVSSQSKAADNGQVISRLVAIVNSPLKTLFDVVVEGAPTPTVVVVAIPSDTDTLGKPTYAMVHSSETGECPNGQTVLYLTTLAGAESKPRLDRGLDILLAAAGEQAAPKVLYKLYYEQSVTESKPSTESIGSSSVFSFPSPSLSLAFDDAGLDAVKEAWRLVVGSEVPDEDYLVFEDREGADADDDVYD